jgi:hypothetical protein
VSNQSRPFFSITVQAQAPIPACSFVGTGATLPAAVGADTIGVTRMPALAVGDEIPVDVLGTAPVVAGAALNRYQEVMTDAVGNAVPVANSGKPRGKALQAAASAGVVVEILLYND